MPCDAFDDGAAYSMSFNMTKEQAADLYKNMVTAWNEGRDSNWPEKIDMPFKKLDEKTYEELQTDNHELRTELDNMVKIFE